MERERTDFRDRLMAQQRTTPALREAYRQELDALVNCRLTAGSRALTWCGIVATLALAGLLVRGLVYHHDKPGMKLVFPAYLAVAVGVVIWLGRVLWQGGFARRASYAVVEWLGGAFAGVYTLATLLHGMRAPSDPANLMGAIWAVMLLMVGFAWGTGNRIAAAALETRAQMLRMESRLADLAERVGK